ncbi:hypothetical protein [Mycoplasma sp. VS509_3]|uniref:hypothetical protein n=1 Tax=unclassified Mycoplasma TaxID=2683645 RepID=UPI003AAD4C12
MENKLLSTLNLITTVSNTIQPNATIENKDADKTIINGAENVSSLSESQNKELMQLQSTISSQNSKLFSDIADNILDNKFSSKKVTEAMPESDIQALANVALNEVSKIKGINTDKNNISENNKLFIKEFKSNVRKISLQVKKSIKENKKNNFLTTTTNIERISTTSNNNWAVNNDGQISSKFVLLELKKLDELYDKFNQNKVKQLETINKLNATKRNLIIASISSATIAAALYAASFFSWGATTPYAVAATITSTALSVAAAAVDYKISILKNSYSDIDKLYEFLSSSKLWSSASNIYTYINLADNIVTLKQLSNAFKYGLTITNSTAAAAFFGIGSNLLSIGVGSIDLYNVYKEISATNTLIEAIKEISNNILDKKSKVEKIEWVVVNETPMDKLYTEGGSGGQNLMFMNLVTKEVKPLEYFISMTKSQLHYMGLTKAYHPITGWYIKKLPNKTMEDNLG